MNRRRDRHASSTEHRRRPDPVRRSPLYPGNRIVRVEPQTRLTGNSVRHVAPPSENALKPPPGAERMTAAHQAVGSPEVLGKPVAFYGANGI